MKAYFFSDLHLSGPEDRKYKLFVSVLNKLNRDAALTHLFLVGDIFDLWIADHSYFINKYHDVVEALRKITQNDVVINYFEGNHDLYLHSFWQEKLGVRVHPGPATFNLGALRLRVEHGDLMDPDDRGYLFLHWLLRTPPLTWLAKNLPENLVAYLGEWASRLSRSHTTGRKTLAKDQVLARIHRHVQKVSETEAFDLLVSGHFHVRDDAVVSTASGKVRSVNLGTWLDKPMAFMITSTEQKFVDLVEI